MDVGEWLRGLGLGEYEAKAETTRSIPMSAMATSKNSASLSATVNDC
jgi:hypothetical protein